MNFECFSSKRSQILDLKVLNYVKFTDDENSSDCQIYFLDDVEISERPMNISELVTGKDFKDNCQFVNFAVF